MCIYLNEGDTRTNRPASSSTVCPTNPSSWGQTSRAIAAEGQNNCSTGHATRLQKDYGPGLLWQGGGWTSWPNFRPKSFWALNTCQICRASQENSELNYLVMLWITNYSPIHAYCFIFVTRLISIWKCQIILNIDPMHFRFKMLLTTQFPS